ncbi:MAG: GDP-mannose 4,6-dehydratase [Acidimicrobiia bacterium]|nr:GDP-mannose 4,6-dehydratase [Acidimicrobiia bacterium]
MRTLLTGAAGFVGPHLARALEACGDEVVGLDQSNGPDLLDGDRWVDTFQLHAPDVVFHLAGWSDVSGSWQQPVRTFQVNALGTLSVLEAARQAKVSRVVLISSADVYGPVSPDHQPITELLPPQPRSPYGVSKQAAEALGLQYHRAHGLDVVIVRPFNHLGPGQSPQFAAPAFALQIASAEHDGGGEILHGDLSAKRDLTDVRDVVRAYRMLAMSGEPGEIYNVCSGTAVAMSDLLDMLVAHATVPIRRVLDPARLRPVELPVLQGSHTKLTEATGWEPEIPLARTLADVLADARHRSEA